MQTWPGRWSCGTQTVTVPVHSPPLPSVALNEIAYTRPLPGTCVLPVRSLRTLAVPPLNEASGQVLPSPSVLVGSSCVIPVMVMVTGSPSGSVTPLMVTSTNWWFGCHCSATLGVAPEQSGGLFLHAIHSVVIFWKCLRPRASVNDTSRMLEPVLPQPQVKQARPEESVTASPLVPVQGPET